MRHIEIFENSIIELDDDALKSVKKLVSDNPNLEIIISGNTVEFGKYVVGEIQTDILKITIMPRNPALSISKIFEMAAFVSIDNFIEIPNDSFSATNSFGVSSIYSVFDKALSLLLQNGLTGNMQEYTENSKIVRGKLITEKYHPKKIILNKITSSASVYSLNILPNQIIKSAIKKLVSLENSNIGALELTGLLRDFDEIEEFHGELHSIEDCITKFVSANPYYPMVLEYSKIILLELKIEHSSNDLNWYAFLLDSNSIFEKFVRKLVSFAVPNKIEKWNTPKTMATGKYGTRLIQKAFSPDILVDYVEGSNAARLVLDVKNKSYNPEENNIEYLVSSADLYQIIFYCQELKSNIGGLIYPCVNITSPIKLEILSKSQLTITLIGLPMKESMSYLINFLKKEVQQVLISS